MCLTMSSWRECQKQKAAYIVSEMRDNSDENVDTDRGKKLFRTIKNIKTSPSCFYYDRSI